MVSTHLKNISQFGSSPQIGMKINISVATTMKIHLNSIIRVGSSMLFFKALWRGMMSQTPTYPASFPRKAFWKARANLKQNLSSVLVGQNENHIGSTPPPKPSKGVISNGIQKCVFNHFVGSEGSYFGFFHMSTLHCLTSFYLKVWVVSTCDSKVQQIQYHLHFTMYIFINH